MTDELDPPTITRRRLLVGAVSGAALLGAGATGVATDVLPGRLAVRRRLGLGEVERAVPDDVAPEPRYGSFRSSARGRDVTWALALPAGVAVGAGGEAVSGTALGGVPVVLVLHGRGDDAHAGFEGLGLHRFLAAHVSAGGPPLALVSVDGGERYWHPRPGDDPLAMILDELLPRVAVTGLSTSVIGVLGWSMGGFGGLSLARESAAGRLFTTSAGTRRPVRVGAVAAGSPALFRSAGESSSGSFTDAEDFARWGDLIVRPGAGEVPLHVSCGTDDPFAAAARDYREAVDAERAAAGDAGGRGLLEGGITRGRHDYGYWRWLAPAQLAFLADRLQR